MSKFAGKIAVIVGASRGVGASIAVAFAKQGAKVTVIGRNKDRLAQVAKECMEFEGCEVLEISTDLSVLDNLKAIIEKTVERFGGIDILVNNAGAPLILKPVEQYSEQEFDSVFNVGVKAAVFLSKFALTHLKKSKGCIVNISGASSIRCFPGVVPICMSKSALDHFTRGFATECASFGVRVNSVNPGRIDERSSQEKRKDDAINAKLDEFSSMQPFGLIGPDELADTVLFVCSSAHMTGSSVVVDGGTLIAS